MTNVFAVPAVALVIAAAAAQDAVRLVRVPDSVRLPAAPGSNLVLEVEAAAAAEVWLATDLASRDRVKLAAAGERRWQLNLAEATVAAMLPAGRDAGELFVFAKSPAGTVRSAAIGWSRASGGDAKVRCLVRGADGRTTMIEPGGSAWLDPAAVASIEVQGAGQRQHTCTARLGELELPLQRRADAGLWVLDGGATLRERLQDEPALEIEARLGGSSALFAFAVVPGRLPLRDGGTALLVAQRKSAPVPGSNGWLVVHIDDITMGGTALDVATADGRVLVPPQIVHEREAVAFALADERYVLVVDRLVNLLIGDDHAELHVERAAGYRPDRIAQLVRAVGDSEDLFVREGKEYAGPLAMQFLIARLGSHRGPGPTVDAFVDELASRSSRTGEPYHVRKKDGTTVTMQEWLRAALRELEAKERAAQPKR